MSDGESYISRGGDTFAYNRRGEVASATIAGQSESHAYDFIGNSVTSSVSSAASGAVTELYTANDLNQYTSIIRSIEQSNNPNSLAYTANGDLVSASDFVYSYDALSRLTAACSAQTGLTISNEYDHLSRRIRKVAPDGDHVYFYDGWNLVLELIHRPDDSTDRIEYYWGPDLSGSLQGAGGIGGLLYLKRNGIIYIPFYDAYGNILGYYDAAGNVVASYTYDAFGKTIATSGPLADVFAFRYSTKYFDSETELYYYGYRYYSPELRRWITRDPIEENGGFNVYLFCDNAALNLGDGLGLFTIHVHTEGVGHVGIMTKEGVAYDFGRYFGKYSAGLIGKIDQSGPNILVKGNGLSQTHTYTRYSFKVCALVDKKVTEELDKQFSSGSKILPTDVIARYDSAPSAPLSKNMRYMRSDWSINNNCQTFTFKVIANAAKAVGQDKSATKLERRQAAAMISLSFLSCWQPAPVAVKSMLGNLAKRSKWITEGL